MPANKAVEVEGFCRKNITSEKKAAVFVPSDPTPSQLADTSVKRGIFGALLKNHLKHYFPEGKAFATDQFDSPGSLMWEVIAIKDHPAHLRPKAVKFWFVGQATLKKNIYYKLLPSVVP